MSLVDLAFASSSNYRDESIIWILAAYDIIGHLAQRYHRAPRLSDYDIIGYTYYVVGRIVPTKGYNLA